MHVELQAACSALGYHEGNRYMKEPDCIGDEQYNTILQQIQPRNKETVKELIRFLRREDDTCDIRRQLGHAQILQKDLIPLIKQYSDEKLLFDVVLRLLVNLTQPVIVCFNNQLPDEKTLRQHCIEIESHLQEYKMAFVDEELFLVFRKKMNEILELDWEHRHEEEKLLLERLLILIRNVLHIPPDPVTEQRTDDDASLHDQILWAMTVSGMEDTLLYIASSEAERQLCMHVLEIVSLMFREQSPEILAHAGVQRSMTEKEKDERELEMARAREKAQKKNNRLKFTTRHSNFGGTYVMKNVKSLSDRELIYHKSIQNVDNFTLDSEKKRRQKPRNRLPIRDTPVIRRSTLSIRLSLKEFCVQFLENAYNPLMYAVKDKLTREATQELDETYYLWTLQFFMEFCRHHSKHIDFVSETMSLTTFHYIHNNLTRYYEMIMMEKKEAVVWGRRVHLALRAYQELLMTLDMMDRSENKHLQDSAKVIKTNIFYMMEFRDIFISLLRKFDETKNSRTYLKDLVESTHLFLRMMEQYSKNTGKIIVQGKKRAPKRKKNKESTRPEELTQQNLEELWEEVSSDLSAILQGRSEIPEDITPFNAASEVDVDQQRVDAMVRIHTSLRNKQSGEAVAVFRAAREVWPERNEFGSENISQEEEFMALREIFMAPLPGSTTQQEVPEEPLEEENEVEEEVQTVSTAEQEFDFKVYLNNYAKPQILKNYILLAADFEKNSAHTNHCIAKMLHRIGFELGYIGMLFQASLFRIFQRIMHGPAAQTTAFQELHKLAVHVIRQFSATAMKNTKVFMELLFWKTSKEALMVTEGYDYSERKAKVLWTEDEENELIRLFEDLFDSNDTEKDVVDLILERWTGETKTRGQVLKHLKNLHLITSVMDLKKKGGKSSSKLWQPQDEQELRELFEKFKDSSDPLGNIKEAIIVKRSKAKVIEKLIALGLVKDRKELYKKRSGKSGSHRGRNGDEDDDNQCEGEEGFVNDSDSNGDLSDDSNDDDKDESESENSKDGSSSEDEDASAAKNNQGVKQDGTLNMLKNVIEKGYQEQVSWIRRLLFQNAEYRETEDKSFSVPIVPLTEDNETALEDQGFTDFIRSLGLSPPISEQEMFWRIPAEMTATHLRNLAAGLELNESNEVVHPELLTSFQHSSQTAHSVRGCTKAKAKKDKQRKKKKTAKHDSDQSIRARKDKKTQDDEKKRKDDSLSAAAQRREALRAMLERRKDKKVLKRQRNSRTRVDDIDNDNFDNDSREQVEGDAGSSSSNARLQTAISTSATGTPIVGSNLPESPKRALSSGTSDSDSNISSAQSPVSKKKQKRRVKRTLMDSDSDENNDRLVIDEDEGQTSSTVSRKLTKRLRLLDSDVSDDNLEDMETSYLSLHSAQNEARVPGSGLSQSQDIIDFGDSSDENANDSCKDIHKSRDITEDMHEDVRESHDIPENVSVRHKDNDKSDSDSHNLEDTVLSPKCDAKSTNLPPESFPATLYTQGSPGSDDSDIDDHVPLRSFLKKSRKILSDEEED